MSWKHQGTQCLVVLLLSIASCGCTVSGDEAFSLRPVDVSQFIAPAEVAINLQFSVGARVCNQSATYVVQDYSGAEESRGVVHCKPTDGILELPLKLHRGYHEIRFPAINSTYGVIALSRVNESVSEFFSIDTAFSYLESSPVNRSQFLGQLSRLGIGAVRDRINWNELHPDQGGWNGSGQHQFDDLRQLYAKAGIKVVDVLHGLPVNPAGYFPSSTASVAAVSEIAAHWGEIWNGIEVSNEPDHNRIYDNLSPEEQGTYQKQYADYASLASRRIRQAAPTVPVVGGAFAYALAGDKVDSSKFAEGVAAAGLLQSVDAISFHTYVDPKALKRDIGSFKDWLRRSGAADMPLWITEAGWAWKRGPERPPPDQDQASALQIAGKAIVAYGMGINRYYAFVYPYYEEKDKNFGMTGKERTPLRSLAAYEQVAKALSRARPLTGVNNILGGEGLAALFKTPNGAVMAIYDNGPRKNTSCLEVPFKPVRVEGIDGRPLLASDGKICPSDGLIYVWIADADISMATAMLSELSGKVH